MGYLDSKNRELNSLQIGSICSIRIRPGFGVIFEIKVSTLIAQIAHVGYHPKHDQIRRDGKLLKLFGLVAKRSASNTCVLLVSEHASEADSIIKTLLRVSLFFSVLSDWILLKLTELKEKGIIYLSLKFQQN